MRYTLYILLILLSANLCFAQSPEADTTWNLGDLDYERAFDEIEEIEIDYSSGWFPHAFDFDFNFGVCFGTGWGWDRARDIRPTSLVETINPYTSKKSMTINEAKIKNGSDENVGSSIRNAGSHFVGLQFKLRTPIYLNLLSNVTVDWNEHFLYSTNFNKSFLTHEGQLKDFKEVTVARIDDVSLSASGGLMIPIYGAFLHDAESAEVHYYLYVGGTVAWSWLTESRNYAQIANADDQLRYRNGLDTMTMIRQDFFDDFNRTRYYGEIAFGSMYDIAGAGFSFQISYSYLLDSMIKSEEWKRHSIRISMSILTKGMF